MTESSPLPQFEPYRPISEIARGGIGRVLLATSPSGQKVALKVARDKAHAIAQVRREYRVLEDLSGCSPYVVRLASPLVDGPPPWFALDFVPGQRLSVHMEDSLLENALPLVQAAARGIDRFDQELFVSDLWAGADPTHRLNVRFVCPNAWHSVFVNNMFINPPAEALRLAFARPRRDHHQLMSGSASGL